MSRSSSGIVAGLTAAAVAVVGFLAYQAAANVPKAVGKPAAPSASPSAPGAAVPKKKDPTAIPPESGTGARVVYALAQRRVWLVNQNEQATRSFAVMPSTVSPMPGSYRVTSRSGMVTGTDGVRVEHVVRFTTVNDVTIGFGSAADGSLSKPDPTLKTGGVRMKKADGNAVWTFATVGSPVVVVP